MSKDTHFRTLYTIDYTSGVGPAPAVRVLGVFPGAAPGKQPNMKVVMPGPLVGSCRAFAMCGPVAGTRATFKTRRVRASRKTH